MPGSIRASPAEPLEDALDEAEFVLALMTSGSYVSDICRAEQLRALRKDKCLIPLKAQSGADVPLHLEAKNYRDFTADSRYPQAFTELLADLHAGNGIALKPEFRETSYVTVPPLPVNFVERPEALAVLRDVLIADDGGRHIALTALQGMGGIGKTVLPRPSATRGRATGVSRWRRMDHDWQGIGLRCPHPHARVRQGLGSLTSPKRASQDLDARVPRPWLRPLRPVLDPAGGAMIRV